jgi:hypothetical protein
MLRICSDNASQNVWNGMFVQVTKVMIDQSVFIISLKEVMSQHTIGSIYFPNVHSHLICGLVFCGGGTGINGSYKLQKRGCVNNQWEGKQILCREMFRDSHILSVACIQCVCNWNTVLNCKEAWN